MLAQRGTYGVVTRLSRESGVSRPTLYAWRSQAEQALLQTFSPPAREPTLTPALERQVLTVWIAHSSDRDIQTCFRALTQRGIGLPTITAILAEAEQRALRYLATHMPATVRAVALDEIYGNVAGMLLDRPHTTPLTQRNRSAARPKPDARRAQRRETTQEARETISDGYGSIAAGVIERAAQPKPKQQRKQRKQRKQRWKQPPDVIEQRREQRQQRRREQTQQARETINDGLDDVAAALMRRAEDKQRKTGARPL
jgi:hypothetical protein